MTRRDDAIKAAAREIDPGAWEGATALKVARRAFALEQATVILNAALAVLQPVVPNTAEALEALPVGTVIRSNEPLAEIAERLGGLWLVTGMDDPLESDTLRMYNVGDTWIVLWWGDGLEEPA